MSRADCRFPSTTSALSSSRSATTDGPDTLRARCGYGDGLRRGRHARAAHVRRQRHASRSGSKSRGIPRRWTEHPRRVLDAPGPRTGHSRAGHSGLRQSLSRCQPAPRPLPGSPGDRRDRSGRSREATRIITLASRSPHARSPSSHGLSGRQSVQPVTARCVPFLKTGGTALLNDASPATLTRSSSDARLDVRVPPSTRRTSPS